MLSLFNTKYLCLLILFEIFIIPLLTATPEFGFEEKKVVVFLFLNSLVVAYWAILLYFKKLSVEWTRIKIIAVLFLGVLLITSLLGVSLWQSIIGSPPYFQGLITYAYLVLFGVVVSTLKIDTKKLIIVLNISALLVSFIALKDFVLHFIYNFQVWLYSDRVVSTFGQPNFYAGFLLIVLAINLFFIKEVKKAEKICLVLSCLVLYLGIFVSFSKSVILIALLFSISQLLYIVFHSYKTIILLFLVFIIFFSPLILLQNGGNKNLLGELPESRIYIYGSLVFAFYQKPILGYGLDTIDIFYKQLFNPESNEFRVFDIGDLKIDVPKSIRDLSVKSSHNYLLDIAIFSGIGGVGLWIYLIYMVIKKAQDKWLIAGLLAYLAFVMVHNQSIVHLILFWLMVGLVDQPQKKTDY